MLCKFSIDSFTVGHEYVSVFSFRLFVRPWNCLPLMGCENVGAHDVCLICIRIYFDCARGMCTVHALSLFKARQITRTGYTGFSGNTNLISSNCIKSCLPFLYKSLSHSLTLSLSLSTFLTSYLLPPSLSPSLLVCVCVMWKLITERLISIFAACLFWLAARRASAMFSHVPLSAAAASSTSTTSATAAMAVNGNGNGNCNCCCCRCCCYCVAAFLVALESFAVNRSGVKKGMWFTVRDKEKEWKGKREGWRNRDRLVCMTERERVRYRQEKLKTCKIALKTC